MKAIKIIGLSLMTFTLVGNATAQRDSGSSSTAVSNQEYLIDTKTLATYFEDGNIPDSFPKYDLSIDKEANKKLVVNWVNVSANYALLSAVGKEKFAEYKEKQIKLEPMKK